MTTPPADQDGAQGDEHAHAIEKSKRTTVVTSRWRSQSHPGTEQMSRSRGYAYHERAKPQLVSHFLGLERGEKKGAFAGAGEVGGLPTGAHDAAGSVGVGAEKEMADLMGDSVTEDCRRANVTAFVRLHNPLVEQVGITPDPVG